MTVNTRTQSEFRRYIDENEALPEDCTLGHIAWYGVEDAAYDAAVMEREFMRLGLNTHFLPGEIKPSDAFEKATKEVQGTRYPLPDGTTAEILVREAGRTAHQIVRKLIREVKDAQNKRLSYDEVGQFVFYKPATVNGLVDPKTARVRSTLSVDGSSIERAPLEDVVDRFDKAYYRHNNYHDGQKVRALIRGYLLHLNAIQMKPSVYFVHNSRADELRRLQEFVNGLNPGSATSITLLPLADLPALRVEVADAFQREGEKDLQEVVADIHKLYSTRKGPIKVDQFVKIKEKYDGVIAKAGEHARTLQVSQERLSVSAEVAYNALIGLQEKVVEGQVGGGA